MGTFFVWYQHCMVYGGPRGGLPVNKMMQGRRTNGEELCDETLDIVPVE